MQSHIKNFIIYVLIVFIGILFSFGSIKLYQHFTKTPPYTVADTSIHFKDTHANVILYSTSWCSVCKQTKSFLEKNKVVFINHDIENTSDTIVERYLSTESKVIPTIVINNKIFKGFYPDEMQEELALAKLAQ